MSTGPTPRISTPPRTPNTSAISGSNTHFSGEREKIERETHLRKERKTLQKRIRDPELNGNKIIFKFI